MTDYVPVPDAEGINAPRDKNALRDILILIGGFFTALFILIYMTGFVTEIIVSRVSLETEIKWFQKLSSSQFKSEGSAETIDAIKHIHQKVQSFVAFPVSLSVTCDEEVNAYALPGGRIVLTSGLLQALKTENALIFVIGHEIGHFVNRDHLRGFGRQAAIGIVMSALGLGTDFSGFNYFGQMPMRYFQQHQESEADQYALKLVRSIYGHTKGSDEFFAFISQKESPTAKIFSSWVSTHPPTDERLRLVQSSYNSEVSHPLVGLAKPLQDMSFCNR